MGLTVKRVEALVRAGVPGKHTDGANGGGVKGLMLCIQHKTSAYYVLRWQRNHKIRHMGLGSARDLSLAAAREKAREQRERIALGTDPLELRRRDREAQRQAEAKRLTFKQAAERYFEDAKAGWNNAAHAGEFLGSLERWVYPHIGSLDVGAVDKDAILRVLEQKLPDRMGRGKGGGTFWTKRAVTADRTRRRIEQVLDTATVRGWRSGDNPARWRGFLDQILQPVRRIAPIKNLAAVPYAELPAVMTALAADQSVAAQCLRFIILTSVRRGEAVKAAWSEVNFEAAEWTIPKGRMKARRPHTVPLAPQAIELLRSLYTVADNPFLFVGSRPGAHITEGAVGEALHRAGRRETVHGFRSSFRDWCGDHTEFPREVAEAALAHAVGDQTEQAYRRRDALEKRRKLMEVWAEYCCVTAGAIPLLRKGAST